jgi:SAM-dependent methyltransferase
MLSNIYKMSLQLLELHPILKRMYFKLAVLCSNNGIRPPFSGKADKVEKEWREQQIGHPSRNPLFYVEHDESVDLLFLDILPFLDKEANILEIGCNAGRNLNYLYSRGFKSLTGIEIGIEAEDVMKEYFPDAYKSTKYIVGNAYEELIRLPSSHYDLVFAHSVLVNIAPRWNAIFKEMARVSKSYVLTMESEGSYLAYPRDFEKMFKKVGLKQILYKFYNLSEEQRVLRHHFIRNEIFKNNTIRLFVHVK